MSSPSSTTSIRKLLLVEGAGDRRFFAAFVSALGVEGIEVESYGGKPNLGNHLADLVRSPTFLAYSAIGIVRDADNNASSTFDSVVGSLQRAKLPTPPKPESVTTLDGLRVSVLIVPPNSDSGDLEDMCLRSIEDTEERSCTDAYISCLEKTGPPIAANRLAKAKVHAYLAAGPEPRFFAGTPNQSTNRRNPGLRVGEAAEARVWNWASPAFAEVADFLRNL